jgi:hypothetical protein
MTDNHEMSVMNCQWTWHIISEGCNLHQQCCENLKWHELRLAFYRGPSRVGVSPPFYHMTDRMRFPKLVASCAVLSIIYDGNIQKPSSHKYPIYLESVSGVICNWNSLFKCCRKFIYACAVTDVLLITCCHFPFPLPWRWIILHWNILWWCLCFHRLSSCIIVLFSALSFVHLLCLVSWFSCWCLQWSVA